jgi:hypothetical protein
MNAREKLLDTFRQMVTERTPEERLEVAYLAGIALVGALMYPFAVDADNANHRGERVGYLEQGLDCEPLSGQPTILVVEGDEYVMMDVLERDYIPENPIYTPDFEATHLAVQLAAGPSEPLPAVGIETVQVDDPLTSRGHHQVAVRPTAPVPGRYEVEISSEADILDVRGSASERLNGSMPCGTVAFEVTPEGRLTNPHFIDNPDSGTFYVWDSNSERPARNFED